jgi:hypothetical protein
MKSLAYRTAWFSLSFLFLFIQNASGWHDLTHMAIAKAAGYKKCYNAAGPDITKTKADGIEKANHWFNNNENLDVTEAMVFDQVKRYDSPRDEEGHLYGAIVVSLCDYRKTKTSGKYGDYFLAFTAHYLGDLSNPLHNTPSDDFNKERHGRNDGVIEGEVLENITKIEQHMYEITLNADSLQQDLAKEIARLANAARMLGFRMRRECRDMTKEEAYTQAGHSASLLKAILKHMPEASGSCPLGK